MGSVYGFSRDGTQLWNASTGDGQAAGRVDYLGGSYIIIANDTGYDLIHLSGGNSRFVKRLFTFSSFHGGSVNTTGIAINHSRIHTKDRLSIEPTGQGFDGVQSYSSLQIGINSFLYMYNYQNPQSLIKLVASSGTRTLSGVAFNGKDLFVGARVGEGEQIRQYAVDRKGFARIVKGYGYLTTIGEAGLPSDICFDGVQMWTLDSQNCYLFRQNKWTTPKLLFSHGVTGAKGITFDGEQLIIVGL